MYPTNLHNYGRQFFPPISVCPSIHLSLYASLSEGFWMYPANHHNHGSQFFPQYLSVHLFICLSIHPPYYTFFSAGPLTDILTLEVRGTVEFTRVWRHECWLFLMCPPDAISTFLHLAWPGTLVSVACISEAPFSSAFRCTQYFWQQTRGPKENEVQVTPSPASWLWDVSLCDATFDSPSSLHLYLHV